jgi:hypothetical protein
VAAGHRAFDVPHVAHARPFALGPLRPGVNLLIDAVTGDCHALDPPDCPPGLPYLKLRDETIRFRAEVIEPGESFDQTGFGLPAAPQVAPTDSGQGELFGDDYSQPDSVDHEPVFWTADSGQDFAADARARPALLPSALRPGPEHAVGQETLKRLIDEARKRVRGLYCPRAASPYFRKASKGKV